MSYQDNDKNYCHMIDIYRFFFIACIALMHFETRYFPLDKCLFKGAYLGVEFFFVLSGYLFYKSFNSSKKVSVAEYVLAKMKQFMPYNIIMLVLFLVHNIRISSESNPLELILRAIPEAFFLQLFFDTSAYNVPTWYISVLIVVSIMFLLIYDVCKEKKKYAMMILVYIYIYLYNTFYILDLQFGRTEIFKIAPGFLRGIAGMALGAVAYEIGKKIQIKSLWIRWISIIGVFCIMFIYARGVMDFIILFFITPLIINEFTLSKYQNEDGGRRIGVLCKHLGNLSMVMFFTNFYINTIISDMNVRELVSQNKFSAMVIYLVIVILFSELLKLIVDGFWKIADKRGFSCQN